ncbi:MAG: hypothetical protein R2748_02200 [Bryobacterales bacterium]
MPKANVCSNPLGCGIPRSTTCSRSSRAGPAYRLEDNVIYNAGLTDLSNKIPGGGLLSTSGDLVRFALATLDGSLLKPATVAEMWTPQVLKNGEAGPPRPGLGVAEIDGEKRARHTGGPGQGTTTN